jgi:hypothetical protein
MKDLPYLYQLANNTSALSAIALAISIYCITLLGPSHVIQIHNLFLRIWVENGTPLFLFVFTILGLTAWRIETYQITLERAVFWTIIFAYFFIPRHI